MPDRITLIHYPGVKNTPMSGNKSQAIEMTSEEASPGALSVCTSGPGAQSVLHLAAHLGALFYNAES